MKLEIQSESTENPQADLKVPLQSENSLKRHNDQRFHIKQRIQLSMVPIDPFCANIFLHTAPPTVTQVKTSPTISLRFAQGYP